MSQSQSDGYKTKIYEGYAEARRRAKSAYAHGVTNSLDACAHDGNALLVFFLQ